MLIDVYCVIPYGRPMDHRSTRCRNKVIGQGLIILAHIIARVHRASITAPPGEMPDHSIEEPEDKEDDPES